MDALKRLLGLAGLAALALCTESAGAQEASQDAIETNRKVNEYVSRAMSAWNADDVQGVIRELRPAFAMKQRYDIACSLGEAELVARDFTAAAEHLTFCLENVPYIIKKDVREKQAAKLEQARAEVGTLKIETTEGAEVFLDGEPIGRAPLRGVFAAPGRRSVEARREGYVTERRDVSVEKKGVYPIQLMLARAEGTGDPPAPLPVQTQRAAPPPASPAEAPERPTWPIYAGAIAAGAVTVAGVVSLFAWDSAASDARDLDGSLAFASCQGAQSARCAALDSAGSRAQTFRALGFVGIGAGVALGTATLVYGLSGETDAAKKRSQGTLVPLVGQRGGGLSVVGSW